jgi:acyl-coenzyme A thioesterase PaaI-like protein
MSARFPDSPAIQDFYPDDVAHCFGCGRLNERGHRFRTRAVGEGTLTQFTPEPWMTALPGLVYGGLIASLLDCHSTGSAAVFALAREGVAIGAGEAPRFVTRHLAVDYLAPTPMGPLRAVGRLVEATDRKVIVESDLEADGALTAKARAVLIRLDPASRDASAGLPG